MAENTSLETIVDEIFDEGSDYSADISAILWTVERCYIALIVAMGILCNIMALLLLIRRRLWHQHEAYVYVAAILIINILEMVIHHSSRLVQHISHRFLRLPTIADITCKVWDWAVFTVTCIYWLHVPMLLNAYLRQQLKTSSDRRRCFTNLAAKYCSLLGTKVIVISFFIFWVVPHFWNFLISSLQALGEFWLCTRTLFRIYWNQYVLLEEATFWLGMNIPLLVGCLFILLIVWKKKISSDFVFSQANGVSQDNGDVEAMAKIVLCCATVFFVLRAPLNLVFVMKIFNADYLHSHFPGAFNTAVVISLSSPLSTLIVCFTVKSRFRDALRTMIEGWCCRPCRPGTRCNAMLSQEVEDNASSVLQMYPIDEDLSIAESEEGSDLPNRKNTRMSHH